LDEMFKQAGELGVEITVCEMSMGINKALKKKK